MSGFIINLIIGQTKTKYYCKQLFTCSSSFITKIQKSLYNDEGDAFLYLKGNHNVATYNTYKISSHYVFHHDPYIEMLGYKILKILEMCPKFSYFRSALDLKTYVMTEDVALENYIFYNKCDFKSLIGNMSEDDLILSMRQVQKLKLIHFIFWFCDFNNGNYALKLNPDQNVIENIYVVDFWTCPIFLKIEDLLSENIIPKPNPMLPRSNLEYLYKTLFRLVREKNISLESYFLELNFASFYSMANKFFNHHEQMKILNDNETVTCHLIINCIKSSLKEIIDEKPSYNEYNKEIFERYMATVEANISDLLNCFQKLIDKDFFIQYTEIIYNANVIELSSDGAEIRDIIKCNWFIHLSEKCDNIETVFYLLILASENFTINEVNKIHEILKTNSCNHKFVIQFDNSVVLDIFNRFCMTKQTKVQRSIMACSKQDISPLST